MPKASYNTENLTAIGRAVYLLEENAEELRDAFQLSNGTFLVEDRDIQNQINDIERVVSELRGIK